jgi:hypothetical protein
MKMAQEPKEIKVESSQKVQEPAEAEQASTEENQQLVIVKEEVSQAQEMLRQLVGRSKPKVSKREILLIRSKVQKAQQMLLGLASRLGLGKMPEEYEVADELEKRLQEDRRRIQDEMEKMERETRCSYYMVGTTLLFFLVLAITFLVLFRIYRY